MDALKKAEAELKFKQDEYHKQRHLVDELKADKLIPLLKEEYEGKCFKERNSYGAGSDTDDWFIYYFIKKVTSDRSCEAITMQIEPYGKFELGQDRHLPLSMCKNEITKEAFLSAVSGFEKHFVNTLEPCR